MAAPSKNSIRVRLHFDFPPPAVVSCRMCWMLVDTASCRFIADLESVIRDKFEFSQGSILSLFIEECYLPHTESILVVRDNDCIRVRLDTALQVIGPSLHLESPAEHRRKRRRDTQLSPVESSAKEYRKTKKRKKSIKESVAEVGVSVDDAKKSVFRGSGKEKGFSEGNTKPAAPDPEVSSNPVPANGQQAVSLSKKKKKKKKKKKSKVPSDNAKTARMPPLNSNGSSSSSSEEEVAPLKQASKAQKSPVPLLSKKLLNSKPAMSKALPPSEIESLSLEHVKPSPHKKAKPIRGKADSQVETKTQEVSNSEPAPSDQQLSGNEEEIELVIHRPVWPPNFSFGGHPTKGQTWGRGSGRDGVGDTGGARGKQNNSNGYHDSSYQTDILSNTSVVIQNGAPAPKPDYSAMPLLAAPPPVGQKIAFKLLELTENYSPEVSDYKEGKVVSFDPTSQQIELELLNTSQVAVEPGKFDLVYQNPDGSERVEYAVSRGSWVTERWDSLLEPRLII
ncbi:coilin isoform X2 [Synchiropus splendidus]|uniref:coilin isoform X2 n=1 Tax=Synchiropus splendidus TaxID=270530 RepID=UPI00237D388C|nr:coilin isoform X2 [Synchiropus splendidus]